MNKHQFIRVADMDKVDTKYLNVKVPGAAIMCPICGEVQNIYADGSAVIVVKGNLTLHDDK